MKNEEGCPKSEVRSPKSDLRPLTSDLGPLISFSIPPSPFAGALNFYRKALYLDPNHHETLLQMSLLLEKLGDARGAQSFHRRAAAGETRLKVKGERLK